MCRGIVLQSGLLDADEEEEKSISNQNAGSDQRQEKSEAEEREKLKEQLMSAKKIISELRATNSKLHAFVMQTSNVKAS